MTKMILSVENLSKEYDKNLANDNINISFKTGVNGLLGANGAGKTTLMKMLVTVLKPTGGNIYMNGENILKNEITYRDMLGYLPQEFNGYPEFSATELMYYMGKLKNMSDREIKTKTEELFSLVSLSDLEDKKIKTFSGGTKRRLGIAQALLNDPKILILDEPTAGLDPKERIKFRNIISKIAIDKIVILSTHIVTDIENIASNMIIMKQGKVLIEGTKEEIISKYSGKVWECNLPEKEADITDKLGHLGNYKVETDGSITLRIISDTIPHQNARLVDAEVEDVFLYYFGEEV